MKVISEQASHPVSDSSAHSVPASSAATDQVLRSDDGPVATLTINRPGRGNSITPEAHQAMMRHLAAIRDDKTISVVILTGAGERFFCAGHDLGDVFRSLEPQAAVDELMEGAELARTLRALPQIVIARVNGIASGAGLQIVAAADLAIAAGEARFATPGVNIGLWCYGPMVDLGRNVSSKHAMQMLATGRLFDAEFARSIGLVNEVVARVDLDAAVRTMAMEIAQKSGKTFEMGKPAFYAQLELSREDAYTYSAEVKARHVTHPDAREGIQAFLDKRKPVWTGR